MACELDGLPINAPVEVLGLICTNCGNSFKFSDIGIYDGHVKLTTGKYAHVWFIKPHRCPSCDLSIHGGYLPCEEDGLADLFVRQKENVEVG